MRILLALPLLVTFAACKERIQVYPRPKNFSTHLGTKIIFDQRVNIWYAKANENSDTWPNVKELKGKNQILVTENDQLFVSYKDRVPVPGVPIGSKEPPDFVHRDYYHYVPTRQREFEIVDSVSFWVFEKFLFWEWGKDIMLSFPLCYVQVRDIHGKLSMINILMAQHAFEREDVAKARDRSGKVIPLSNLQFSSLCGRP